MKRYSLWVKCLVFFLAIVTALGVAVGALGVLAAESMSMYTRDDYRDWLYDQHHNRAYYIAELVLQDYGGKMSDCPNWILEQTGHAYAIEHVEGWYELSAADWCYTIQKSNGAIAVNTYTDEFAKDAMCFKFEMDTHYPMLGPDDHGSEVFWDGVNLEEGTAVHYQYETGFTVTVWLNPNSSVDPNNGLSQTALQELFALRYGLIVEIAVSLVLFVIALIFLLSIAGRDSKTGEINPRALNRLPLDLYLAVAAVVTVIGCMAAYELLDMLFGNDGYNVLILVLLCGCGIIVAATDVGFFTAVASQFKVSGGFWWRHSLCGRLLKLGWKLLGIAYGYIKKPFYRIAHMIRKTMDMLPVVWKWIAAGGILGIILLFICATSTAHWYNVFPLVVWCLAFAIVVIYCGYSYGIILKGIKRLKAGDLNEKINTQWLYGSFKTIAEDLNALADVVAIAAEKQLKAERMKTELITNVSHDIKTPLTSVINYVDLLQQPHTEEEGEQYLEVLSRQSGRLKKLVEDLMDMSKASSGNITVNVAQMDAVEAVNQALGEFADKFDNAQLTPVFRSSQPQMPVMADGRLTWRVLSNLLGNVVKYALPGTRVYLDLKQEDRWVVLSIKNISREELNISAEELTERFVRGDASRNTEGSGLGLNIAQSLMRLQRGNMEVIVDGDLFKVTLTFPAE